jgi:two-component system phosphate regulon sensor histidine kinase PhoR
VILVALFTGGLYVRHVLRSELEARITADLVAHARVGREMLRDLEGPLTVERVDPLADRLGKAAAARITVVAPDGRVLGDSGFTPSEVRRLENHGHRPEVREALARGQGRTRRHSTSLRLDMLYLALPFETGAGRGVVRAALALDQVASAMERLNLLLMIGAILALGMTVIVSFLGSRAFGYTLRRLVTSLRNMVETPHDKRLREAARLPEAGGELGGLIGSINRMAGEIEQLAGNLVTERDRFIAVLEGLGEGVLALNRHGQVTHCNGAAMDMLQLTEPPVGRTLHEAVRVPALHDQVETTGDEPTTKEIEVPHDPPRRLLARVARQPKGGLVLVFHDLTELRRLEKVRKDFVANVSHELRTPISVILANTETLLDGALEDREQAAEFLSALRRNAERLSTLISDLLALSRIDAGKYPLETDRVDLAAVIRRAILATDQAAKKKGQRLSAELPDGELMVNVNEEALSQVVHNLLDNAVKYTQEGGRITVSAGPRGDGVRLQVRDDGPGIEPRHRERIFERFYRVDKGRSRAEGGTGLGLAIVKNLVEAMGGQLGVDGAIPRGSVFWVALPTAEASLPRQETPTREPRAHAVTDSELPPPAALAPEPRPDRAPSDPGSSDVDESELVIIARNSDYRRDMIELRKCLLLMVGQVEEMIALAIKSLVEQDAALAAQTIRFDRRVNRAEIEIDEMCLALLSRTRPSPADLRFLTLALKTVVDLERIGDLAVNICERAVDLARKPVLRPYTEISQMAQLVAAMLRDAVDALVDHDADKAQSVIDRDDLVDRLYLHTFREIMQVMVRNSGGVERGIQTQAIAKWLERMADHITNIAEQVIFLVQGKDIRHPGKLDVR